MTSGFCTSVLGMLSLFVDTVNTVVYTDYTLSQHTQLHTYPNYMPPTHCSFYRLAHTHTEPYTDNLMVYI
jgi:hypothetical protein